MIGVKPKRGNRIHIRRNSKKTYCGLEIPKTWSDIESATPDCGSCHAVWTRFHDHEHNETDNFSEFAN